MDNPVATLFEFSLAIRASGPRPPPVLPGTHSHHSQESVYGKPLQSMCIVKANITIRTERIYTKATLWES